MGKSGRHRDVGIDDHHHTAYGFDLLAALNDQTYWRNWYYNGANVEEVATDNADRG
jgi:hypothetical protein